MANEARFTIHVDSNAEQVAGDSATALEKLRGEIAKDQIALRELAKAKRDLRGGGDEARGAIKGLDDQIIAHRKSLQSNRVTQQAMGDDVTQLTKKNIRATVTSNDWTKALQGANGPVGSLTRGMAGLGSAGAIGLVVGGVVLLTAAVIALTAATVAAVASLAKYGLAQADARRSELLRLEGLTKIRRFMIGGLGFGEVGGDAKFLQTEIDKVAAKTSIARSKVAEYERSLKLAGIRGGNLQLALEAMAITGSAQGDEQAKRFRNMAVMAQFAGMSIKALADDVKARLGGIVERQMLSLDVQSRKLRESLGLIFADLKIEGVLRAVKSLTERFSQSTASGRALKQIAEIMLTPIGAAFEFIAPISKRFFQGMIIGVLRLSIMLLTVRNRIRDAFDFDFGGSAFSEFLQSAAVIGGQVLIGGLVVALGGLAVVAGILISPFLVLGAMFAQLVLVVGLIATGITLAAAAFGAMAAIVAGKVLGVFLELKSIFTDVDWLAVVDDMIEGLVGGIVNGAGAVIDAMKNLGSAALGGFKSVLGIASRSKVFMVAGLNISQGVSAGIEAGSGSVTSSAAGLGGDAAVGFSAGSAPSGGGGAAGGGRSSGPLVTIGELVINGGGGDSPEDFATRFRQQLDIELEGLATQLGARPAGAT